MAKGKHSVALFEVIHKDKRFAKTGSSGVLKTPKWWFKNRPAGTVGAATQGDGTSGESSGQDGRPSQAGPANRSAAIATSPTIRRFAQALANRPFSGNTSPGHTDRDRTGLNVPGGNTTGGRFPGGRISGPVASGALVTGALSYGGVADGHSTNADPLDADPPSGTADHAASLQSLAGGTNAVGPFGLETSTPAAFGGSAATPAAFGQPGGWTANASFAGAGLTTSEELPASQTSTALPGAGQNALPGDDDSFHSGMGASSNAEADTAMSAQASSLHHSQQESTLTRTSAAIIGGSTAVAAILAICVGRWFHPAAVSAGPNSTAIIQQGPASPEVLDVRSGEIKPADAFTPAGATPDANNVASGGAAQGTQSPESVSPDAANPGSSAPGLTGTGSGAPGLTATGATGSDSAAPGATPSAAVATGPRQINLNYLLVQSYAEEKYAQDAAAFLQSRGISCTVEHNLPGWGHMFAVVGCDGFSHISTPDYKQYLHRVEALSKEYAPSKGSHGQSYKAFRPMAVKWTRAISAE